MAQDPLDIDPVVKLLRMSPLTPNQRRAASEAFTGSSDEDDLSARMESLKLPRSVMANLWDLKAAAPRMSDSASTGPEGSALSRFASNAGEMLNPVTMAQGIYQTVRHPIDTGKAILGQQADQFGKAAHALGEGRYSEAVGHGAASLLPVVGPLAADIGEQIGSGDVAGGLGKTAGLVAPLAAVKGAQAVTRMAPEGAAAALERGAATRVQSALTPKTTSAKGLRMGVKAEKIAPEIAADTSNASWTQQGFRSNIQNQFKSAAANLDEVSDARLSARTFRTDPIIKELRAKRAELTAESVDASLPVREVTTRASSILDESGKPMTVSSSKAVPVGRDVVPGPNAGRVAQIDKAIAELEALGPAARYEPLRKIRQAYDGPAEVAYNPATTPDFLAKRGEAMGAADVTGTLREHLAGMDPATAQANKTYALYKSADTLTSAIEELERSRPKVGRQIMARLTGTLGGAATAGSPGAIAGFVLGPIMDTASSMGLTTKLQTAKAMTKLAQAIRRGDMGAVESATHRLRALVPAMTTRVGAIPSAEPAVSR